MYMDLCVVLHEAENWEVREKEKKTLHNMNFLSTFVIVPLKHLACLIASNDNKKHLFKPSSKSGLFGCCELCDITMTKYIWIWLPLKKDGIYIIAQLVMPMAVAANTGCESQVKNK